MKIFYKIIEKCRANSFAALLVLLFVGPATLTKAQDNIVYPPNSGIVHMVDNYGLVANDLSEAGNNTAKIQQAIDKNKGQSFGRRSGILYFPNGTYYVNNKMSLGVIQEDCRYITFQGQSRTGTVLKLADGSAGFEQGANKPVIVFTEASGTNSGFKNYVKNLTIDIGTNNPGAVGVDFICNNHGGLFDVTIKSTDSQKRGAIGLKMDRNLGGIGLIKNVRIEGFDIGIKTGFFDSNYVFEYLELDGQQVAGIQNTDKPLSIRKLTTTNINGPAIINTTAPGHIVIIDSDLSGSGAAAIDNQQGFVFVRNVTVKGYSAAINDRDSTIAGPFIAEYSSHGVYRLWDSTPAQSLNLEIRETPKVPWEQDFSKWVVVDPRGNGAEDDAPAIQAAIDSCTAENGKNTVCIRVSTDNAGKVVLKTPIVIRGNVQRFLVLGALFKLEEPLRSANGAVFTLEATNYDVLEVEGIDVSPENPSKGDLTMLQNNSTKTVVLRDVATRNGRRFYRNGPSAGPLFVEVGGHQYSHLQEGGTVGWECINQDVWARNIDPEDVNTGFVNDGGKVWILGYKFESDISTSDHFITKNGGFTEVLGGVDNGPFPEDTASAIHINDNSNVTHISAERSRRRNASTRHTVVIREIRGEVTREFKFGDLPIVSAAVSSDTSSNLGQSSVIPLYVGYKLPRVKLTIPGDKRTFTACDTVKLMAQLIDFDTDASVRFYASGQLIGAGDGSGRYGFNWSSVAPGQYALTAEATDSSGNKAVSGEITITVEADTTPPVIAVKNSPAVLWPPNHKYHSVNISDFVLVVTDSCAGALPLTGVRITKVSSDEAEDAPGSGNTRNDISIGQDCQSVQLRAERQGNGNGRVYTIEVAISDPFGNEGTASYQVQVPRDRQPGAVAIADAPAYNINCGAAQGFSQKKVAEDFPENEDGSLSAYPNPFSGQATIRYQLTDAALVRLEVYNAMSQKVATLVNRRQEAGLYEAVVEGANLPEGFYICRLQAGNKVQTVKLVLVKN